MRPWQSLYSWKFVGFNCFHPFCLPQWLLLGTTNLFSISMNFCVCVFFYSTCKGTYTVVFLWFVSVSILPLSIHVVTNGKISFFYGWIIHLHLFHCVSTHIPTQHVCVSVCVCVCVCVDYTACVGFHGGSVVKHLPAKAGDARDMGLISGSGRSPGGGNGKPTPVFLPEKSHRQRCPAGCSWTLFSNWAHMHV